MTDQPTDQPTSRLTNHSRVTRVLTAVVGILALAVLLLLASALVTRPIQTSAQEGGCTSCSCPPGSTEGHCWNGSSFQACACAPGGEATPAPAATQVIEPPQPPPGGGETPVPGSTPAGPAPTQRPRPTASGTVD